MSQDLCESLFHDTLMSPQGALRTEMDFKHEIIRIQTHLSRVLSAKNTLFAPIFRLADECMAIIFYFSEMEPPANVPAPSYIPNTRQPVSLDRAWPDPRSLIQYMLVCRQWHRIIMNSPNLWATIGSQICDIGCIATLLDRSRKSSLRWAIDEPLVYRNAQSLFYRNLPPNDPTNPVFTPEYEGDDHLLLTGLISEHQARIETLEFTLASSSVNRLSWMVSPRGWVKLKSAVFIDGEPYGTMGPAELPLVTAENLRHLILDGLYLKTRVEVHSFPNLRTFVWKFEASNQVHLHSIVTFLSGTPNLEEFEGEVLFPQRFNSRSDILETPGEVHTVRLLNLKRLSLKGDLDSFILRLPKHLDIPQCTQLFYSVARWEEDFADNVSPEPAERRLSQVVNQILVPRTSHYRPQSVVLEGYIRSSSSTDITFLAKNLPRTIVRRTENGLEGDETTDSPSPLTAFHFEVVTAMEDTHPEYRARDIEVMLTQLCTFSLLQRMECSIAFPPWLWVEAFTSACNLRELRFTNYEASFCFADSLTLSLSTTTKSQGVEFAKGVFLPVLALIEICEPPQVPKAPFYSPPRGLFGPHSPTTSVRSTQADDLWKNVLAKFAESLSKRADASSGYLTVEKFVLDPTHACPPRIPTEGSSEEIELLERLSALVGKLQILPHRDGWPIF